MNKKPSRAEAAFGSLWSGFATWFCACALYECLQSPFHWPNVSPWVGALVPLAVWNVVWLALCIRRLDEMNRS